MGAGTNCQNRLIALHDCDCPWRPADLEQRSGRIIRQGHMFPGVEIYRYVTEKTFDAYLFQLVENKQKFIGQIMTSRSPVRSAEDVDEQALSYAEIKALATGNPEIKEKMDLDIAVSKLKLLKSSFLSQKYELEDRLIKFYPQEIQRLAERIEGLKADIAQVKETEPADKDSFAPMVVRSQTYTEKSDAGTALIEACKSMTSPDPMPIGSYRGFEMILSFDTFSKEYRMTLHRSLGYTISLSSDIRGNLTRIDNALDGLEKQLDMTVERLETTKSQQSDAKTQVDRPFPQEQELQSKTARLNELNTFLNMDEHDSVLLDGEMEIDGEPEKSKNRMR